jgi:hypothetical protein
LTQGAQGCDTVGVEPEGRQAVIDDRRVVVLDGRASAVDVARLAFALRTRSFTRSESARFDTGDFRHWASEYDSAEARNLPLYAPTAAAVEERFPGHPLQLQRAYCNAAFYGDMLFTHVDAAPEARAVTAIWYVSKRWDVEWGGETLFFDRDGDAVFVVSPRPGRLVLFDGAIPNVGRPPNRICPEPRFTFAFKFVG